MFTTLALSLMLAQTPAVRRTTPLSDDPGMVVRQAGTVNVNCTSGCSGSGGGGWTPDGGFIGSVAQGGGQDGGAWNVTLADTPDITDTLTALNDTVTLDFDGAHSVSYTITGTWSGTVSFESSPDGTNWISSECFFSDVSNETTVASTTTNGTCSPIHLDGFHWVRARATAWTSGSATVIISSSRATVSGAYYAGETGTPVPSYSLLVGGSDGTNLRNLSTDTTGALNVINPNLDAALSTLLPTTTFTGRFPTAVLAADAQANPTATQVESYLFGYNGTTWDRLRKSASGLLVDIQNTSIAVTQSGTWNVGLNSGTNYVGKVRQTDGTLDVTLLNSAPGSDTGQVAMPVRVISSLAGGAGGTSSSFGSAFPASGTAAGFSDGTNMQGPRVFDADTGAGSQYVLGANLRVSASGGSNEAAAGAGTTSASTLRVVLPTDQTSIPATQSGTWNITNVSGTVSLPTGAATAANQTTLGSQTTKINDGTDTALVSAAGALIVDGSGSTQPVSGTVTADTELPAAAALADTTSNPTTTSVGALGLFYNGATWDRMRGDTTNGLLVNVSDSFLLDATFTGRFSAGAAASDNFANPTTTGVLAFNMVWDGATWDRLPGTSATGLTSNTAFINGVAPSMGNGISGTGVQRVTLASDSTGQVTLATGANVIGSLTANQSVNLAQVGGTSTVTGGVAGSQGIGGLSASGAAKSGNPVQVGGVFNSTQPTVTTGQTVEAQSTARGGLIVATGVDTFTATVTQSTASNLRTQTSAEGATGSAVPANAINAGFSDGTNLRSARVYDVDTGGGTQYALGSAILAPNSGGATLITSANTDTGAVGLAVYPISKFATSSPTNTAVTCATTATLAPTTTRTSRVTVTLYNNSSVTIYIGGSGVTTSNGLPLLPGASFTDNVEDTPYYCRVASGTADLRVMEN